MGESFIIKCIKWDRVFLQFDLETNVSNATFHFVKFKDEADIESRANVNDSVLVKPERYVDGLYTFNLNICQMDGRSFLENGRWHLAAETDGTMEMVKVDLDVAECYDQLSRVFPYAGGRSYIVTFPTEGIDDSLNFIMNSCFMIKDDNWKKKRKGAKGILFDRAAGAYRQYSKNKVNDKNILFLSQTRDAIWGNLKAIDDRMKERGIDKQYHISYYFHNDVGNGYSRSKMIQLARLIARQHYVFVDDYVPIYSLIDPPQGAKLIQVWHAGVGFKAVGYCRFGKSGSPHPVKSCHRKYTNAVAPTDAAVDVYREVFAIEKEAFIKAGMPRLDGFADKDKIDNFRQAFFDSHKELAGRKMILFAPTYRGKGQRDAYYDYNKIDLKKIREVCGDEYAFIIKMHPFITESMTIPDDCRNVIYDYSDYPDINELYYIADLLITDYSSDYFEYSLLGKPVIFYTYDRRMYQLLRGVHRDVKETAPGKVCDTLEELIAAIANKDFEIEKTDAFREQYFLNMHDNSADTIIDAVLLAGGK